MTSTFVDRVEQLLEEFPRQDRSDAFDLLLTDEAQAEFWAERSKEERERTEQARLADPERVPPPRGGRFGRQWNARKHPRLRGPAYGIGGGHAPEADDDDVLRRIAAKDYVEMLTGEAVPPSGMIRCVFPGHADKSPSLKVYPGNRGVWCHGCHRGGDIFNFGAELWGLDTREDFPELRRRMAGALLGRAAT